MNADAGRPAAPLAIAYLLQQFPLPTETFAVSDIAALIAQGHRVTVYTMKRRRPSEAAFLKLCNVPADLSIDRPAIGGALSWPMLMWRWRKPVALLVGRIATSARTAPRAAMEALLCLPRLVEVADRVLASGDDVVHAFWSRHAGLVLPLLETKRAVPLRSAFVGAYDLVEDDFLVDLTLSSAEIVFSHAEANRGYVERKARDGAATAIVPRGIPLPPLLGDDKREPFRCLTASALTRSKNVEAVIRACAAARPKEPRLTLRIFGDGPDRERLEQLTRELGGEEWVTFAGHIARDKLFGEMQRASVFLLLSQKPSERLPNVVKEALWAGCAVICSKTEGIEELVVNSSMGRIVDAADSEAIAAELAELLQEEEKSAADRRARTREFIAANFSSDRSMRRYVDAWRNLIRREPSAPRSPAPEPERSRPAAEPEPQPLAPLR